MAHGYLGDGYGSHGEIDPHRGDDRDRRRQDRGRDERGWRGEDRHERDRNLDRGMMFGGSRDYEEDRRSFSAHPDDHYRSWRDRHMSELDRDYADYCREREQQFHREFDTWRRERHASYQPLRTGMTNSGLSHDPSGELQQTTEATLPENDAMSAATLGTNGAPQSGTGRSRSRG